MSHPRAAEGIPIPIVTLNRAILAGGVVTGLVLGAPVVTTALLAMLLAALLLGPRGSLAYRLGSALFPSWVERAVAEGHLEDRRLVRFNNAIAATLLGGAQVAFAAGAPDVAWAFPGLVALASIAALSGFCLGCHLFPRALYLRNRLTALRA